MNYFFFKILLITFVISVTFILFFKENRKMTYTFDKYKLIKPQKKIKVVPKLEDKLLKPVTETLQANNKYINLDKIAKSAKVTIDNVTEKFKLTSDIIDSETNDKTTELLTKIIKRIGFIDNFYIKRIESMYVIKNDDGNYRIISDFFMYNTYNHHIIKLMIDVVYINKIYIVNYINIDPSSINNILNKYDIVWNDQGILSNYNMLDEDVSIRLDQYYTDNYRLINLDTTVFHESQVADTFYIQEQYLQHYPLSAPQGNTFSPSFCNHSNSTWDKDSLLNIEPSDGCVANIGSSTPYPNYPYASPSSIKSRVDNNEYNWLYDPQRGNLSSSGNHL